MYFVQFGVADIHKVACLKAKGFMELDEKMSRKFDVKTIRCERNPTRFANDDF